MILTEDVIMVGGREDFEMQPPHGVELWVDQSPYKYDFCQEQRILVNFFNANN